MSHEPLELQYRQITSQRAVINDNFPQGVIDFNFSIGGRTGFIPNRSYFRIGLKVTGPDNVAPPTVSDQLAFADSVAGNMFTNVYFRAGGQDVSSIVNYCPQAAACKNRIDKSGAWLNTTGKDSYALDADFQSRVNRVSSDVPGLLDGQLQTVKLGAAATQSSYTVTIAVDGVVTGVGTDFLVTGNVVVGDELLISGSLYTVTVATNATTLTVTPAPNAVVTTGATGSAMKVIREVDGDGRNEVYVIYQPPIGIFDHGDPLGSGDYRIQLNPNAYYKQSCVESKFNLSPGVAAGNEMGFNFDVKSIQFYAATCKVAIPATGTETIHLMECQVQSKPISQQTGENLLDFTIPPSTKAISVFVQSGDSGTNTQVPPSMFKTKDNSDMKLASIQLSYANTNKPSTRWSSEYTDGSVLASDRKNYMIQRYNDTQMATTQFWSPGGSESFSDWSKRGPLYHYTFNRDRDDRSTHLQVAANFNGLEANANLLIVAHYTRVVQIAVTNGFVSSVESLSA
jgi:hypothetical protein